MATTTTTTTKPETDEHSACATQTSKNDDDSDTGTSPDPTSGPSSAPSMSSNKMFLPPDILHRCLSNFCDAPTLEVFMVATTTIDTKTRTTKNRTIKAASNVGTFSTEDDAHIKGDNTKAGNVTIDEYFKVIEGVVDERIEQFKPKKSTTSSSENGDDEDDSYNYGENNHCYWRGMSAALGLFHDSVNPGSLDVDQEGQQEPSPSSGDLRLTESSLLSRKLVVLDFFETCPNLIWSGSLRFRDPMAVPLLGAGAGGGGEARYRDRDADIHTILTMSPQTWSIDHLHSWWSSVGSFQDRASANSDERSNSNSKSSPQTTILLNMEPYNFIPIRPRGILRGRTLKDQETLRKIAKRLDEHDIVATQRTRTIMSQMRSTMKTATNENENNIDSSRSRRRDLIGYWILRIISYPQARRRLTTLYGGGRPQDRGQPRPVNPLGFGGGRQRRQNEDNEEEQDGGGNDTLFSSSSSSSSPTSPALTAALRKLDDDMMMFRNTFSNTTAVSSTETGTGTGTGTGTDHQQHQNLKNVSAINDPYSFLVCCWESDRPWEEEDGEQTRRMAMIDQKFESFCETLTDFKHLVDQPIGQSANL